jgi:hypothetical protein
VTALAGADGPQAYDPAELIRAAIDELVADPDALAAERAARRQAVTDLDGGRDGGQDEPD